MSASRPCLGEWKPARSWLVLAEPLCWVSIHRNWPGKYAVHHPLPPYSQPSFPVRQFLFHGQPGLPQESPLASSSRPRKSLSPIHGNTLFQDRHQEFSTARRRPCPWYFSRLLPDFHRPPHTSLSSPSHRRLGCLHLAKS